MCRAQGPAPGAVTRICAGTHTARIYRLLRGIDGAVDLFGDGAIWALPAPGHTPGTTAYFLNTPDPVLVLGDVSHTCWGWENDVPPGTFSHDRDAAAVSFAAIRNWASQIPALTVIAGHTACDEAALVAVGG